MKKNTCLAIAFAAIIVTLSVPSFARTIDPIVDTEWLAANSGAPGLVVLDVRPASAYTAGHIDGAINEPFEVPFSAWITMSGDLLLELPEDAVLFDAIGALGIDAQSKVVVVSAPNPGEPVFYGLSAATRVADTLIYAGVENVAVLDGGFDKWVADGYGVSTAVPAITPVVFDGVADPRMFVSMSYVKANAWRVNLIDARDADVYFGATVEPYAPKAGHIWSALSLPAPFAFDTADNTYREDAVLDAMAKGVLGKRNHPLREIVVYCGVGGYASVWWYLLTQVLGYRNVKFYDGSAQEWVTTYDMVAYQWR